MIALDSTLRPKGKTRKWILPEPAPFIAPEPREPLFTKRELSGDDLDFDLDLGPRVKTAKERYLDEMKKKLAYLHWQKVENAMQIRDTLNTTKRLVERDLLLRLCTNKFMEKVRRKAMLS
jgi:hypothetical protein